MDLKIARGLQLEAVPSRGFKEYLVNRYRGNSAAICLKQMLDPSASQVCCGGRFAIGQLWPNAISTFVRSSDPCSGTSARHSHCSRAFGAPKLQLQVASDLRYFNSLLARVRPGILLKAFR